MNPTNTGSFGAALGGLSPELAAAVQSRQGNPQAGASAQVSQSAPTANPQTMTPPSPTGQAPMPQQPGSTGGSVLGAVAGGAAIPFDSSEAKIIISSLSGRLKALSRLQGAIA